MTSSESSRGTTGPPPDFFVDRSLGNSVTASLRALGWSVQSINDVYDNDAQDVDDATWVTYGCERGWCLLTKDKRIKRQYAFEVCTAPIFGLSNGNLGIRQMVDQFEQARERIWQIAADHISEGRSWWMVYDGSRVERRA